MTKEDILSLNPVRDYAIVISELEKLNIKVRPLKCNKCKNDHYMILLEELGLLEEVSLVPSQAYLWNGVKINRNSNPELIEDFCREHPELCKKQNNFKKIKYSK